MNNSDGAHRCDRVKAYVLATALLFCHLTACSTSTRNQASNLAASSSPAPTQTVDSGEVAEDKLSDMLLEFIEVSPAQPPLRYDDSDVFRGMDRRILVVIPSPPGEPARDFANVVVRSAKGWTSTGDAHIPESVIAVYTGEGRTYTVGFGPMSSKEDPGNYMAKMRSHAREVNVPIDGILRRYDSDLALHLAIGNIIPNDSTRAYTFGETVNPLADVLLWAKLSDMRPSFLAVYRNSCVLLSAIHRFDGSTRQVMLVYNRDGDVVSYGHITSKTDDISEAMFVRDAMRILADVHVDGVK